MRQQGRSHERLCFFLHYSSLRVCVCAVRGKSASGATSGASANLSGRSARPREASARSSGAPANVSGGFDRSWGSVRPSKIIARSFERFVRSRGRSGASVRFIGGAAARIAWLWSGGRRRGRGLRRFGCWRRGRAGPACRARLLSGDRPGDASRRERKHERQGHGAHGMCPRMAAIGWGGTTRR
jgi:hypothetical protein